MSEKISVGCPQGHKDMIAAEVRFCLGGRIGAISFNHMADTAFCICASCEAPISRWGRLVGIREDFPDKAPIIHRKVIYSRNEIEK